MNIKLYKQVLLLALVLLSAALRAQTIIFQDGFEDGSFKAEWTARPGASGGVVQVQSTYQNFTKTANTGFYAAVMGRSSDGALTTNQLDLKLDLSTRTQVEMTFNILDYNDETHPQDGIYFSNDGGATFKKVYNFLPELWNANYGQLPALDIDKLAADASLTLTDKFIIRFQQYDDADFDGSYDEDGFLIDDVSVYVPVLTYATLPFTDGFEAATFGNSWKRADAFRKGNTGTEASNLPDATVEVASAYQNFTKTSATGFNAVVMGRRSDGNLATNALDLHLNLAGQTQVEMTFNILDYNDETHPQDGIYFSNDGGATFKKVYNFLPELWNNNYGQPPALDIDKLAADASLTLTDKFIIRFQQYDDADFDGSYDEDGFLLDDVSVYVPTLTYATLPFTDGFEAATLGSSWKRADAFRLGSTASENEVLPEGWVALSITPRAGLGAIHLGKLYDGGYNVNALDLYVNLATASLLELKFWLRDNNDETQPKDGIYLSTNEGATFTKVYDFTPETYTDNAYQFFNLNLKQLAEAKGITAFSEKSIIRFQQYDDSDFNGSYGADGIWLDDIQLNASEINIKQGTTSIATAGTYAFGSQGLVSSDPVTFTIENLGAGTLNLSGTPIVAISGTNAAEFSINQSATTANVASGASTTFTVTFTPTTGGSKTAKLSIVNNDSDENPYEINLTGTGNATPPEINIRQNTTDIATGGSYDFGSLIVGGATPSVTFTIQNLGTGSLSLTGSPNKVVLSGTNAAEFSVNQSSTAATVAVGASTTFVVSFSPTTQGNKTAQLSIANTDSNENPYIINLLGASVVNPPEINIKQGTTDIATAGTFTFGNQIVGSSSATTTFTIENTGTGVLNISGTPKVAISGTNLAEFTIVQTNTSATVAVGATTTFTVTFSPTTAGSKTAQLSIANSDANENPYIINLTGTGVINPPEINIKQGTTDIATAGTFAFGNQIVGSSSAATTFTIENTGTGVLNLSGSPKVAISGANVAEFSINQTNTSATVAVGATTTFTVTFSPTTAGSKTAQLSIANNDSNENPYLINLTATGVTCTNPAKPTITQAPNSTFTSSTLTASAAPTGGTYQWLSGSTAITGATSQTFTTSNEGSYSVRITIAGGCSTTSDPFVLVVTAVEDLNIGLSTYPNPVSDYLTLSLGELEGKKEVAIYQASGKEMTKQDIVGQEGSFYVADYPQGIYLVKIISAKEVVTVKFLKK